MSNSYNRTMLGFRRIIWAEVPSIRAATRSRTRSPVGGVALDYLNYPKPVVLVDITNTKVIRALFL